MTHRSPSETGPKAQNNTKSESSSSSLRRVRSVRRAALGLRRSLTGPLATTSGAALAARRRRRAASLPRLAGHPLSALTRPRPARTREIQRPLNPTGSARPLSAGGGNGGRGDGEESAAVPAAQGVPPHRACAAGGAQPPLHLRRLRRHACQVGSLDSEARVPSSDLVVSPSGGCCGHEEN